MGTISSMAPLKVRRGFLRKHEKEPRRAAEAQRQTSSGVPLVELARVLTKPIEGGRP
jgi:hypothetical protein